MAKKELLKPSQILEATIREQHLPQEIARIMTQILDIETNVKWRATPEGKKAAKDDDDYSPDDLKKVIEKQKAHAAKLRVKVDFLMGLYDKQNKHVQNRTA